MAILNSSISGSTVTYSITIESTDPTPNWEVLVSSKTDRGLGQTGRDPLCNYFVEKFNGVGSGKVVRNYTPDNYCAGLALQSIGQVDYTLFVILPAPPNAQIFNWCWDVTGKLGSNCPIPTSMPAVIAGTVIDIKADIANSGTSGSIMVIYKIDGVALFTQTTANLGTYPGGGMWSPTFKGYIMPNKNVTLTIESYNWNGTTFVLGQTKVATISMISAGCTGIELLPYTAPLNFKVGDKLDMAVAVSPGNVPFNVTFKDRSGIVLGTCKTGGTGLATGSSSCAFTWDSNAAYAGKTGTYYVKAYADSCMSTESVIVVGAPIVQNNFSIIVKDDVTGALVQGATVLVATSGGASQSKVTDASGLVLFRMDTGTINVSISKNGYNTINTVESLYYDMSKTYYITLIPPTPTVGDIQFVSVPVGAEIYIDGKTTNQMTPYTVTGVPAADHTFTLKLLNFNDLNGTMTVQSGATIQVYRTLTPSTPTTGSLNITSHPTGAEVWVDGKDFNTTTSGATVIKDIPPGTHSYNLTMLGFQDAKGTFDIIAGQTTSLDIPLIPTVNIGTLEISSEPSGARVYIDDSDTQRVTLATIVNLIEGNHKYKVTLNGYKDASGTFAILSGKTTTVHLILEKSGGAGAGLAIVVGIAAIAILKSK